jgi:hypothetical protein
MRIDACVDVNFKAIGYTKAIKTFVELDPCNFIMTVGFETFTASIVLISYDWGEWHTTNLNCFLY